jgi:hypothetical protein
MATIQLFQSDCHPTRIGMLRAKGIVNGWCGANAALRRDAAADTLRYLVATKSRAVAQRKLREFPTAIAARLNDIGVQPRKFMGVSQSRRHSRWLTLASITAAYAHQSGYGLLTRS